METSWTEDIIVTVSGWLEAAGPYLLVLLLVVVVVYRSRQLIAGIIEGMRGEQTSLAQEARVAAKEEREAVDEPPVPKPPARRPQKPVVFLSYRRQDAADVSGRIYDRLTQKYSRDSVFNDVDSIPLGADFEEYIDEVVSQATICLLVVGPNWLGVSEKKDSPRRIDDPQDFVRLEVAAALKRRIPVIPLLVGGSAIPSLVGGSILASPIPSRDGLPEDVSGLTSRQGIPIRPDPDFDNDIGRLLAGLDRLSGEPRS